MVNVEQTVESEGAPSPFLPGTDIQYALDSTSIGYFKRCPRLYYYTMIEGWRQKNESIHLKFGSLFHEALHNYDLVRQEGEDHDDGVYQVVKWLSDYAADYPDVSEDKASKRAKSFEGLLRTVVWYLDQYSSEKDPAKTVILSNGKPACELSFRFELDWGPSEQPYLLCGHLDRVVEYADHTFVMDHKTTTRPLTAFYFDQFQPDNQMSLYTIAGKIVLGSPVRGVIVDAVLIKEKEKGVEFARGFTYRTEDQNEEWLRDLRHWTIAMEGCATSGSWPMNDTACDKYGGCPFRNVCSKSPSVRERFLEADFERSEPWNPLAVR